MRILLCIVLLLTLLLTLWCAAGYFTAPAQQIETGAELSHLQATRQPPTDTDIALHVSRVGQQGRNSGIAAILAGASAFGVVAALVLASKRKTI
jgi:hypothetical protein